MKAERIPVEDCHTNNSMTKQAAAFDCLVLKRQSWRFRFSHKTEELKMTECVCPKSGVVSHTNKHTPGHKHTVNHPPWLAQPIHPFAPTNYN